MIFQSGDQPTNPEKAGMMAAADSPIKEKEPPPIYKKVATGYNIERVPERSINCAATRARSSSVDSTRSLGTRAEEHSVSNGLDQDPGMRRSSQRKATDLLNDWWLWELGALIVSVVALIVLIAILRKYEGKPTPRWSLHITINALISVCSIIFKGTMIVPIEDSISQIKWIWFRRKRNSLKGMEVFDRASRGVEGSACLLFSRQALSLASIGAVITVLTVASDPFFQQLVDYPTQSVAIDRNGTQKAELLRAVRYEEIGPFGSQGDLMPELPMQKAIYGALFDGPATVTASCPSGNCTWDPFTTLGVCSKCQDISSMIKESTVPDPAYDPSFRATGSNPKTMRRYQLPSGLYVTLPDAVDTVTSQYLPALIRAKSMAPLATDPSMPWTIVNVSTMSHRTAFECSLYWCLKSYNSSTRHGSLFETPLPHMNDTTTYDRYNGTQDNDDCATAPQPISNEPLTAPTPNQLIYVSPPNYTLLPDVCVTHLYSPAGSFYFSSSANTALQDFLAPLLTGNLTWQGLDSFAPSSAILQSMTTYGKTNLSVFSDNATTVREASRATAEGIDLVDIPGMMNNLTASMTVRMRMAAAEDEGSTILGTVYETQAVVQIHWKWLALPILLLVGTMLFLGLVVWVSRRSGTQAWKSSATAMLFHGLDEEHLERVRGAMSRSEMEELAKEIKVQLMDTERRRKLT